MSEVSRFYAAQDGDESTHLALRWKSRVRYTVPIEPRGQQACWMVFRPGMLGVPLRAMARLPRLFGSASCTEGADIELMRKTIGSKGGLSCCRAGAAGPWSKDTILLLDEKTAQPAFFVKAGTGEAVDALLQNEANWLRRLREQTTLSQHIPELVAHRSGQDLCFVAQRPLSGDLNFILEASQFIFLQKLQKSSVQSIRYEDSRLYRNLSSRLTDLDRILPEAWAIRLHMCMDRLEQSLSEVSIPLVAAHNDFTPWNIRVERGVAKVFDWEYADSEQLPLFDALHFVLLPMALKSRTTEKLVQRMRETLQICEHWLGKELCYKAEDQALAYLTNVCTLYLWGARATPGSHAVLDSYAEVIDSHMRA